MIRKFYTHDEFISEANRVHNFKYDYSKTVFTALKYKILIICPIHGEFTQLARYHLQSTTGCSRCEYDSRKTPLSEFIEEANKIYNNYYDYSESIYIKHNKPITIKCPIHGEIITVPVGHLKSYRACRICHPNRGRLTPEEYIKKAREIHGDKYDYSKMNYTGVKDKITIICPRHGEQVIAASGHISLDKRSGCRQCFLDDKVRVTPEKFIAKCKAIHNDKYIYNNLNFKSLTNSIFITCPIHGEFRMKASTHYDGVGCIECYAEELELTGEKF